MFGPSAVTTNILDIGTRSAEDKRRQVIASGSGAMCPSKFLGEPAAFDIPNVADVSTATNIFQGLSWYFLNNEFLTHSIPFYSQHIFAAATLHPRAEQLTQTKP
jgi:hypothetical protein